jgi:hypothetical protein
MRQSSTVPVTPLSRPMTTRSLYVPPSNDEPLDENELAFVRALAHIIAREIREEAAAQTDAGGSRIVIS